MYCELLTFKHEVSLGKQFHQPFFCCCHPFGLVTPTFIVKISRSNKEITKPPPYHMCMNFRVLKSSLDALKENNFVPKNYRNANSKVKIEF